jgi:hypothetical protein
LRPFLPQQTPYKIASNDIIQVMEKKAKFSVITHWISNLGDSREKTFIPFNLVTVFYCIFNFLFTGKMQLLLPNSFQAEISVILFYTFSLLLILFLFFPVNKNYKVHRILSNLIFVSIIGALVFSFLQLSKTVGIPFPVIFFLTLTTVVGIVFLISFIKLQIKCKEIPKTLENVRKKEKSLLIRNVCLLEWIFFLLLICFQIITTFLANDIRIFN